MTVILDQAGAVSLQRAADVQIVSRSGEGLLESRVSLLRFLALSAQLAPVLPGGRAVSPVPHGLGLLRTRLCLGTLFLGGWVLLTDRTNLLTHPLCSQMAERVNSTVMSNSSFFQAGAEMRALLQMQAFCHTGIILCALCWHYRSPNRQL